LLEQEGIAYSYREYRKAPLDADELRAVFRKLGLGPRDLLRRRDKAFKELDLDGNETDEVLIAHMAQHPTLLERPIGVRGTRAVVGRPIERLLDLA